MFSVRELATLVRRLNAAQFAQQMGPFALMQRPAPEARVETARIDLESVTQPRPIFRVRSAPATVDFGNLIVATLPPLANDGSMQLVIGRAPDCDLVVHDTAVSKHHARVCWDGEVALLEELGSSNGTFVNNHQLRDRWALRDGDELTFGESHFLFLWAESLRARLHSMKP
jgi:hypothetical protein